MKTLRIYISRPVDQNWDEVGPILRDVKYITARALNYCMTELFLYQRTIEEYKEDHGKYPTNKELPFPPLYKNLRREYPEFGTRYLNALEKRAKDKWKTDLKEVFYTQTKSLPTFKKTTPLLIDKQALWFGKIDGQHTIKTTLFSTNREGQKQFSFFLNTKKTSPSQKAIFKKIVSGEYRHGSAQIDFNHRKKKWYANFAYEAPKKTVALDPEIIVGIHLGSLCSFTCAVSNSKSRIFLDGKYLSDYRRNVRHRRLSYLRQGPYSNRKGRGRNKILKPVLDIGDKERRFRDTCYHQYSRMIVKFAVKNNAGTIRIEGLNIEEKTRQENIILKDWAIADFQNKLKYKAEEFGIEVKETKTVSLSQRCFKCGCIDVNNRKSLIDFKCVACGHKENAEYNAALNLTLKDIEQVANEI